MSFLGAYGAQKRRTEQDMYFRQKTGNTFISLSTKHSTATSWLLCETSEKSPITGRFLVWITFIKLVKIWDVFPACASYARGQQVPPRSSVEKLILPLFIKSKSFTGSFKTACILTHSHKCPVCVCFCGTDGIFSQPPKEKLLPCTDVIIHTRLNLIYWKIHITLLQSLVYWQSTCLQKINLDQNQFVDETDLNCISNAFSYLLSRSKLYLNWMHFWTHSVTFLSPAETGTWMSVSFFLSFKV